MASRYFGAKLTSRSNIRVREGVFICRCNDFVRNWARLILQKPRKGSQDLRNLIDGTEDKIVGTWIGSLDAYMYSTPGHQRHSEISIWKSFSLFVEVLHSRY